MAIPLTPPPRQNASALEEAQWREILWRYVRPSVSTSGDADADIPSASTYHGVTALSDPRTLTLPPTRELAEGDEIVIQDESGLAGTHTITIAGNDTETVNGGASVSISTDYGRCRLIKRGNGAWFSA